MSYLGSSVSVQLNAERDFGGEKYDPMDELKKAILDAIRARGSFLWWNGNFPAAPLEPIGVFNALFPKQTFSAAANPLRVINRATLSVRSSGGKWGADVMFANGAAIEKLGDLYTTAGIEYAYVFVPELGEEVFAFQSGRRLIPVIQDDFIPINDDNTTTLAIFHTRSEIGVKTAVPKGTPNVVVTVNRANAAENVLDAEFKFSPLCRTNNHCALATDFSLA